MIKTAGIPEIPSWPSVGSTWPRGAKKKKIALGKHCLYFCVEIIKYIIK